MYRKTVLGNGIRVVTEKIPFAHSVSTGIWVNTGSRDEKPLERGLTHFIEHMLFKGTKRRSALDIAKEFDAVGGFANAFTSKEHICFHAKVLAAHLPLLTDLLSDLFLESVFDPAEIEREQSVIVQEIRMVEDTPDEFIHVLFQEEFWKHNPLGLPIYGTVETVEKADRNEMTGFVADHFNPSQILISAAGNLEHDHFLDLIGPAMEKVGSSNNQKRRVPPDSHFFCRTVKKDLEQVHLLMGMPGTSQRDEARFASHLLNVILGSSMSSRLFQEIREKRGLAYSVYSFSHSHEDSGMTGIYAGVSPQNVNQVLSLVNEELSKLVREPISETELNAAREYVKGNMYINAESNDYRMNRLAKNEFLFGDYVAFEEIERKIHAVTSQEIRAWFGQIYNPEKMAIMLYGPVEEELEDPKAIFNRG
ncbi:MAG: pitrilysin family protein [Syntrophobacteraceae bacterium]|nr:pitrilysin family protein [Syntrophobacteraceae bacterium]